MVHANPYSSGTAALIFLCSITEAVAHSYEVDGISGRLNSEFKVPILLYIGRRGRVIEDDRANILFPSLLKQIDPCYRPDTSALVCLDLHVGRPRQSLRASL